MASHLYRILIIFFFLFLVSRNVYSDPITQAFVFAFLDNEGASPVITGQGVNFSFGTDEVIPDGDNGTTATALHLASSDTIDPLPNFSFQGRPGLFGQDIAYNDATLNGYLSPWQITLTNGGDTLIRTTPDRNGAEIMEFVTGLKISDAAIAPTISWKNPTTGPTVDRVYYELWNDDKDIIVTTRTIISGTNPESVSLSNLVKGTNYAIRITPENRDSSGMVTRSSNWLGWLAEDGNASGTVLKLVAGSPAGVTQNIDTPATTFKVEFDYRFETTTGSLDIFINGIAIGSTFSAPTKTTPMFFHAVIEVEDPSLLSLTSVPMLFQIDGTTGSSIIIDNINFPNLSNGDFEQGLTSWTTSGQGSVSTVPVPIRGLSPALNAAISISSNNSAKEN